MPNRITITVKGDGSVSPPNAGPVRQGDLVNWVNNSGQVATVSNFNPESPFAKSSYTLSKGSNEIPVTLAPQHQTSISYTCALAGTRARSATAALGDSGSPIIIVDTTGPGTGGLRDATHSTSKHPSEKELAGVHGSRR